jgi:hypothetical protein
VIVVVAVCCVGGIVTLALALGNRGTNNNQSGSHQPSSVGVGQPARDGSFEFVVQSLECGRHTVGTAPLSKSASGQFCLVTMTVKNIGNTPQAFSDAEQKGIGATGTTYTADSEADLLVNDNQVLHSDINPGNQIKAVVAYDIPTDAKLAKVELHDSAFSAGVTVNLG